jgi:hypothetical protein
MANIMVVLCHLLPRTLSSNHTFTAVYSSILVLNSSNKVSIIKSRHCVIGGTLVWHLLFHYTTIFHMMGFCKLNSEVVSFSCLYIQSPALHDIVRMFLNLIVTGKTKKLIYLLKQKENLTQLE